MLGEFDVEATHLLASYSLSWLRVSTEDPVPG